MALSNYTELQASIANWMERDNLSAVIPDFIALAEAEMNTIIRARQNTAMANITIAPVTGYADLPADFRQVRTIRLTNSPTYDLESVSIDRMSELLAIVAQAGQPEAYAIDGERARFYPTPSSDVPAIMHYYALIPALSDTTATNWVLRQYPNVYLNGALKYGFAYHDDTENETKYAAKFNAALEALVQEGVEQYGDSATMLLEATTP